MWRFFNIYCMFSDGCPFLSHLDVSWCRYITDDGLCHLLKNAPMMENLIVRGNVKVRCMVLIVGNSTSVKKFKNSKFDDL